MWSLILNLSAFETYHAHFLLHRDLSRFSKYLVITCTNEGVEFLATGNRGSGNIRLAKQSSGREEPEDAIVIKMQEEPLTLVFACRCLVSQVPQLT